MSKVSLALQIRTVEREIEQRRKVYPRMVGKGTLRQSEADLMIEHMIAVQRTLEWLLENESAVRASVTSTGAEDLS